MKAKLSKQIILEQFNKFDTYSIITIKKGKAYRINYYLGINRRFNTDWIFHSYLARFVKSFNPDKQYFILSV